MRMLQINYFSTSLVKLFSLAATRLSPLLSVNHYFFAMRYTVIRYTFYTFFSKIH